MLPEVKKIDYFDKTKDEKPQVLVSCTLTIEQMQEVCNLINEKLDSLHNKEEGFITDEDQYDKLFKINRQIRDCLLHQTKED